MAMQQLTQVQLLTVACESMLFSFEEIYAKQGYQAALKRFCTAKRIAHKALGRQQSPKLLQACEYARNHFRCTDNPMPDQIKARETELVKVLDAAIAEATPTPPPLVETGRLDPACLPLDHPDR